VLVNALSDELFLSADGFGEFSAVNIIANHILKRIPKFQEFTHECVQRSIFLVVEDQFVVFIKQSKALL